MVDNLLQETKKMIRGMDAALDEIKDKAEMKTLNPVEMKKEMKEICRQEAEEQEEVLVVKIVTQMKDFVKELNRKLTKMPDATAKWGRICLPEYPECYTEP